MEQLPRDPKYGQGRALDRSVDSGAEPPVVDREPIVQKSDVVFNCVATVERHQFKAVVTETDDKGHVVYVVT